MLEQATVPSCKYWWCIQTVNGIYWKRAMLFCCRLSYFILPESINKVTVTSFLLLNLYSLCVEVEMEGDGAKLYDSKRAWYS
jgi:hypothetical protein